MSSVLVVANFAVFQGSNAVQKIIDVFGKLLAEAPFQSNPAPNRSNLLPRVVALELIRYPTSDTELCCDPVESDA